MKSLKFSHFLGVLILVLPLRAVFAASGSEIVATIGDQNVTMDEFNKRYDEVRRQSLNPPTREAFLEDLIRYKIGLQEATKKDIKDDPVIAERINQEIYKGLIEKELGKAVEAIKISENDLKRHYAKNPEIRTSHILIEVKPHATVAQKAAARKRAEQIYKDVKSSKRSFEELVNLYSDDTATKPAGGDIGWQTRLTLVPAYYHTAERLKVGQISGIVETEFGFHIIKVTGKNTYAKANKRQIRVAVFEEKRKSIFDKYFEKLKSSYKVKVNKKF
jgi:peptidyl-prolyl cis-trans isomerase C/peptidyl-prolyl cis-trans isomerase D